MRLNLALAFLLLCAASTVSIARAATDVPEDLFRLDDGQTKMANALWPENPPEKQFGPGRTKVVIADLKGPGIITMIHFALPDARTLDRDTLLRIYWDGEKTPSVETPLVDFFCDPNGMLDRVDSLLVNKKQGWNAYFPMPFRESARVEVEQDSRHGPLTDGDWKRNPCYAYVMYRTVKSLPPDTGYFHAMWRQQTLYLGKEDYKVLEADGHGQFIGWNVTVRGVGSPSDQYPVDENVNFRIDGESEPSIVWQGLEDSFGFSYGFPPAGNDFPYTGYHPWYNGASAYRFLVNDRISFRNSLRMTVGFGPKDDGGFRSLYSRPEYPLQFSSVAYWYQGEPHRSFGPPLKGQDRRPKLFTANADDFEKQGATVVLDCGRGGDDVFLAKGWDYRVRQGFSYAGFPSSPNHCWAHESALTFDILCPKGASGTLRLFIIDGDKFGGGRHQTVTVAGRFIGEYSNFQQGRWIEVPISSADTASGTIPVLMTNLNPKANAVVSLVRFVASK